MTNLHRSLCVAAALALTGGAAGPALAGAYNYGSSAGYGGGESGFLVAIEALTVNPRNTDNVVATLNSGGTLFPVVPPWGDELAGRIGLGYEFDSGERVMLTVWGFQASVDAAGTGSFEFPIGPASGTAYDLTTEITARTVDAAWSVPQQAGDALSFRWSVGLRWVSFEETTDGQYIVGGSAQAASKGNQGTMLGGRLAGRATYRRGAFDVATGLGASMLAGDLEAHAELDPGTATSVETRQSDDGRSGTIVEFDLTVGWRSPSEIYRVYAGWEQSVWEDIATDLVRNLPGSTAPLRERDSVAFSGFKVGAEFRF